MNYDKNNIFAKILRNEADCVKVYEDSKVLAFMDVMPCLLYTSPSPRDVEESRMPSSA